MACMKTILFRHWSKSLVSQVRDRVQGPEHSVLSVDLEQSDVGSNDPLKIDKI